MKTFHNYNTVLHKLVRWKTYSYKGSVKDFVIKPHQDPFKSRITWTTAQEPNASMKISVTASTRATALVVVESCIFVLLNIATLVGNSLICFAFYRNLSLRTITNYFVLSLALTDLSMGTLVIPSSAKSAIATNTNGRELGCLVTYFFAWILAGVFNIDGDVVGNKQIFSRGSTSDVPKNFSPRNAL